MIGTLNEGLLHRQLKDWYDRPGDVLEQPVDGYVIDILRGKKLMEIQTRRFAPLRRELDALLDDHHVRLAVPVPLARQSVRLAPPGEILSSRRSPVRTATGHVRAARQPA